MEPQGTERTTEPSVEIREVAIDDPELAPNTNRRLTEELREVIGADRVAVPVDRPHAARGERPPRDRPAALRWRPGNVMLAMIVASLVVVGAVIALITDRWWLLPAVVVVLAVMTGAVVALVLSMTANAERPSATTVAAMADDGVSDPEQRFSDAVAEFTEDRAGAGDESGTANVEDDPAGAADEHERAGTPTGGASRTVGPGSGQ